MLPFTVSSYDRGRDAINLNFMSFNVKMTELFEASDAPEMVLQDLRDSVRDPLTKHATMMNLRDAKERRKSRHVNESPRH